MPLPPRWARNSAAVGSEMRTSRGILCDDKTWMAVADVILLHTLQEPSLWMQQALYQSDVTIKNDIWSNERLWQVQEQSKVFGRSEQHTTSTTYSQSIISTNTIKSAESLSRPRFQRNV